MEEDQKKKFTDEEKEKVISLWSRLYPEEKLKVLHGMLGPRFLLVAEENSLYTTYMGSEIHYTNGAAMLKTMEDAFDMQFL